MDPSGWCICQHDHKELNGWSAPLTDQFRDWSSGLEVLDLGGAVFARVAGVWLAAIEATLVIVQVSLLLGGDRLV